MKQPSEATQIKTLKRNIKTLRYDLTASDRLYYQYRDSSKKYGLKLMKAEAEIKEWKERFDILLRREESE